MVNIIIKLLGMFGLTWGDLITILLGLLTKLLGKVWTLVMGAVDECEKDLPDGSGAEKFECVYKKIVEELSLQGYSKSMIYFLIESALQAQKEQGTIK